MVCQRRDTGRKQEDLYRISCDYDIQNLIYPYWTNRLFPHQAGNYKRSNDTHKPYYCQYAYKVFHISGYTSSWPEHPENHVKEQDKPEKRKPNRSQNQYRDNISLLRNLVNTVDSQYQSGSKETNLHKKNKQWQLTKKKKHRTTKPQKSNQRWLFGITCAGTKGNDNQQYLKLLEIDFWMDLGIYFGKVYQVYCRTATKRLCVI